MNKLPLPSSQYVVWCWSWSSSCWGCLSFQSPWILSRVFPRTPILFLQLYHIAHHHPVVVVLWLLSVLAAAPLLPWLPLILAFALLLLIFQRCISISSVHIPYSPPSCYTINKKFQVRSAVFLQVRLVLLPQVLIQRCIILKLYFSKMCSPFITRFW